jgi:uracil-DNA glycosylase
MESDLGIPPARHGFLEHWAEQGVLLLNSVLTVQMGAGASHQGARLGAVHRCGDPTGQRAGRVRWCSCSGAAMRRRRPPSSIRSIKGGRHLVLKSPHPSPLSAYNGLFRIAAFLQGERLFEKRRPEADRLGVAAAGVSRG